LFIHSPPLTYSCHRLANYYLKDLNGLWRQDFMI
jgi:hypothetical protein